MKRTQTATPDRAFRVRVFKDRVLVVEDDEITRALIKKIPTQRGYEVSEADHGNAGYETAATGNTDLILLDIMMPHLNGLELLSQLKVNDDTRSIPVVMLTGRDNVEDVALALERRGRRLHIETSYPG